MTGTDDLIPLMAAIIDLITGIYDLMPLDTGAEHVDAFLEDVSRTIGKLTCWLRGTNPST